MKTLIKIHHKNKTRKIEDNNNIYAIKKKQTQTTIHTSMQTEKKSAETCLNTLC